MNFFYYRKHWHNCWCHKMMTLVIVTVMTLFIILSWKDSLYHLNYLKNYSNRCFRMFFVEDILLVFFGEEEVILRNLMVMAIVWVMILLKMISCFWESWFLSKHEEFWLFCDCFYRKEEFEQNTIFFSIFILSFSNY